MTFKDQVHAGDTAEEKLYIGNVKSDKSSAGDFKIEQLAEADTARGWSVDKLGVAVKEGTQETIVLKFSPPATVPVASLANFELAEWSEVHLKCSMKGGSPQVMPKDQHFIIVARCKMLAKEK